MKMKKLACLAAAAVMTFSALSASAFDVPKPNNTLEAYSYTKEFYADGYYYEALAELMMVDVNDYYYEAEKQEEWVAKVNAKIAELEAARLDAEAKAKYNADRAAMKALFAKVTKLNSELKFDEALAVLDTAKDYTVAEYKYMLWWKQALESNKANPKYSPAAAVIVKTKADATWVVKKAGWELNSKDEGYFAVKSNTPGYAYDVYIYTKLPGGGNADIAAFNVAANGTVVKVK